MDVILLERVAKLGQMGDTVKVRDGYARNFLLPRGKALRSNKSNRVQFEDQRAQLEARNLERRGEAQQVADKLDRSSFTVIRAAGETGQLYGSVAARDVVAILEENGFNIGRSQVELTTPIKAIGMHEVAISLHAEVEVKIQLNVSRSADEAERQAKGEDLSSADAIYGSDDDDTSADDVIDNDPDYDDEDGSGEATSDEAASDEETSEDVASDEVTSDDAEDAAKA